MIHSDYYSYNNNYNCCKDCVLEDVTADFKQNDGLISCRVYCFNVGPLKLSQGVITSGAIFSSPDLMECKEQLFLQAVRTSSKPLILVGTFTRP